MAKSALELLNAPNSNMPPFDVTVPEGSDPDEMAKGMVGGKEVKSAISLLGDVPSPSITPQPEPAVNVDAYDPIAMLNKMLPKAPEPSKPQRLFEGVTSLSKESGKTNFLERGFNALADTFGLENVGKLSEGAKAQALVMHMAKENGVSLNEYRQSPEFVEQAASSFISMSTLGLAPAIKETLTGEVDYPATDTAGYVGGALGSLAGLYTTPMIIAGRVVKPVLNYLPHAVQNEAVAARIFKGALRDAVLLGPAIGLTGTGEALKQVTFSQASNKIWEGVKSGAMIGAIFGTSRGLFPKEGLDTGARILTGLIGLNAYRAVENGGNPFTNRPMGDVLFDIALDSFFLYKALPKNMRVEVAKDLADLNEKISKVKEPEPTPPELGGEGIPPEAIQAAQAKIEAAKKVQIELEAKAIEEKAKAAIEAKADLEVKGDEVKKIKEGVAEEVVDESVKSLNALGYDAKDIAGMPDATKQLIINQQIQRTKSAKELVEPEPEPEIKSAVELIEAKVDKVKIAKKPKAKTKAKVKEPITDVDLQTGTPLPEGLKSDKHPFRDKDPKHTNEMSKLYIERIKSADISPEVFTRYLINEVNRWLNGEEPATPIEKIRNGLSQAVVNAENARFKFDSTKDFNEWKATVKEAARWAREADRVTNKIPFLTEEEFNAKYQIPSGVEKIYNLKTPKGQRNAVDFLRSVADKESRPILDETADMMKKGIYNYGDYKAVMESDRLTIKRTGDTTISMGVDPTLIKDVFKSLPKNLKEEIDTEIKNIRKSMAAAEASPDKMFAGVSLDRLEKDLFLVKNAPKMYFNLMAGRLEVEAQRTGSEAAKQAANIYKGIGEQFEKTGLKLYSGIDPTEASKQIKALFKPVGEFFKEFRGSIDTKKFDLAFAIKQLKLDASRGLIDQSEALLKEVRRLYPKESQRIIDRQRSAANGKGYGEIEYKQMSDEIFSGKSETQIELINAYILARRFKDIYGYRSGKSYRHQPGYGPDQAITAASVIEMVKDLDSGVWARMLKIPEVKSIFGNATPKDVADTIRSGEAFFEWHRKIVDDLVEAGIKTEAEGELLKAHDYRKFKTISVEKLYDFDYNTQLKGESIKSTNSGVDSLGHGSTKILDPDARLSAHEMAIRAYGSIANQAAKLEWKRLAEQHPDNQIVSTKQVGGWSPMPYFDKGVRKNIYFNPSVAKYLVTRSHDVSNRLSMVLRAATMAPITRSLAVGTSPVWSTFIGLPMDIMHTLWAAKTWEVEANKTRPSLAFPFYETTKGDYKRVYSPYNPLSPLQLGVDMAKTFTDVYTRGAFFNNLAKHGLAMPFLSMRENRYVKGAKPPGDWAKFLDILSYHGVSMETWVRAATANRVIENRARQLGMTREEALKNDDIMYEAVHAARDRMDYNQGGWIIKALDQNGMIFLNAAILGTRTFWRSAVENPIDFAVRSAQLVALSAGITAMAWSLYEDIMNEIPTEGNEKNIVFPLFPGYLSFEDSNGDTRYFYAKMRMDPGPAFMYKMADNLTRTYLYDRGMINREPNYHKVIDSLKNLGPTQLSLPPSIQAGYDYATNYSWWQGRQMYSDLGGRTLDWPKSRVEGQDDNRVSQLAKDVGGVTGASPKRLQGSIGNVIPSNNEFVYMFGKAYEEAFSDVPEEIRSKPWLQTLAEMPGFNRVIGITSPGYSRNQTVNEVNDEVEFKNVVINSKFDTLAENYLYRGVGDEPTVREYIREQSSDIRERLNNEYDFMKRIRNLEHRGFWLKMKRLSTEAKAKAYVKMLDTATPQEYGQIMEEKRTVMQAGGVFSDEFNQAVSRIRAGVE